MENKDSLSLAENEKGKTQRGQVHEERVKQSACLDMVLEMLVEENENPAKVFELSRPDVKSVRLETNERFAFTHGGSVGLHDNIEIKACVEAVRRKLREIFPEFGAGTLGGLLSLCLQKIEEIIRDFGEGFNNQAELERLTRKSKEALRKKALGCGEKCPCCGRICDRDHEADEERDAKKTTYRA
jgi:hypothetical protein